LLVEGMGIKSMEFLMLCLYSAALISYYLIRPVGKWILLGVLILWFVVQFFCHWFYTIFGASEKKLKGYNDCFKDTVRLFPKNEKRIVPDLYHIVLHLLILLNILFLCLFGFWDSTMPRYKYTPASIHQVAGRQGVCTDGEYYWVSGSATLTKYDRDWNVVAENNEPLKGYQWKVNHIGDIDVYQNDLYLGVELFAEGEASNIQVAVYDGDTLERKWIFPLYADAGQMECSGIAVDPESRTVYLSSWGDDASSSCLYMYDLDTGVFKGKLEMQLPQNWIQGVACYDGRLYITCDDGAADDGEPDHLYRLDVVKDQTSATTVLEHVFSDVIEQGEVEGLSFDKENGQLLILYNRGSIIVDGRIAGFREGYTEEVHEVFVYDLK
ncbi:MAG: hypothetical protein J6S31_01570, partial [Lachnospiraceae bacterium]|nr:hypothetical protein [Lachnospiraceae bacterium]